MNNSPSYEPQPTFSHRLGGYYLIPHELLHGMAYKLIGKRYHYQWGAWHVQTVEPLSRWQAIFILLFPLLASIIVGGGLILLSALPLFFTTIPAKQYLLEVTWWPFVVHGLGLAILFYGTASGNDLLKVYWLLFRDQPQQESDNPPQQTIDDHNKRN